MAAVHEVLRYLNDRAPGTQDEHDKIAALIDADDPTVKPAPPASKES